MGGSIAIKSELFDATKICKYESDCDKHQHSHYYQNDVNECIKGYQKQLHKAANSC